jgi:hypothetical protein
MGNFKGKNGKVQKWKGEEWKGSRVQEFKSSRSKSWEHRLKPVPLGEPVPGEN